MTNPIGCDYSFLQLFCSFCSPSEDRKEVDLNQNSQTDGNNQSSVTPLRNRTKHSLPPTPNNMPHFDNSSHKLTEEVPSRSGSAFKTPPPTHATSSSTTPIKKPVASNPPEDWED